MKTKYKKKNDSFRIFIGVVHKWRPYSFSVLRINRLCADDIIFLSTNLAFVDLLVFVDLSGFVCLHDVTKCSRLFIMSYVIVERKDFIFAILLWNRYLFLKNATWIFQSFRIINVPDLTNFFRGFQPFFFVNIYKNTDLWNIHKCTSQVTKTNVTG